MTAICILRRTTRLVSIDAVALMLNARGILPFSRLPMADGSFEQPARDVQLAALLTGRECE